MIYCLAGILIFGGWIFSVCLHEFSHALVAYWGGDTSVKRKGYLTFNPLKYTDPAYSLVLPLIYLAIGGIGLPGGAVYIQESRLRSRWWISAVSVAGVVGNFLFTFVLSLPFQFHLVPELEQTQFLQITSQESLFAIIYANWFWYSLAFLITLQISAVLFNLFPLPPLDGYGILRPWLPSDLQRKLDKLSQYSFWIIFGLFWFVPSFTQVFWDTTNTITQWLGVPTIATVFGGMIFNHPFNRLTIFLSLLAMCWLVKHSDKSQWYDEGNLWRLLRQRFHRLLGKGNPQTHPNLPSRSISSSRSPNNQLAHPSPRSSQTRGFWEEMRLSGLQRQLLNRVQQRSDVAARLLALERAKNPGKSEQWYLEKVLYDLRRGR